MLRRRDAIGWSILTMFIVWPLALWGVDKEIQDPKTPIALLKVQPTRIDWFPQVDFESLVLTVAGPGDLYIQKEFGSDEAPAFSSLDVQGGRLPDGIYTYEFRAAPRQDHDLGEKLARPSETLVQSGHLWVQGGSFMDKVPAQPDASSPASKPSSRNPTTKTTVNDDLIVKAQACIGAGCVEGNADAPALKLRELFDTKIVFENDGCCHPATRNWVLQANEFGDGGNSNGDFTIRDMTAGTIPFRIGSNVPNNALTIQTNNGIVGVGTLTPAVRLDVKASASGAAAARLQNSSATGYSAIEYLDNAGNVDLVFGIDNAASTTRLNSVNNNPIVILTNSTERMRVTSTGDVGIGTSSPAARLDVKANSSGAVGWIQNSSATGLSGFYYFNQANSLTSLFGVDNANSITRLDSINNYPIVLLTNWTERMRVNSAGNIGIGTSSPSSRLHVNGGDIRVSGGSFIDDGVTLNTPDYVFEPNYRLMPLEELREFVTQEKHLPNVPNAREVKEKGINLSQFQMRLLEKVEELTLYTLSQDERLTTQQAELLHLREQNALLHERLATLEQAASSEKPE